MDNIEDLFDDSIADTDYSEVLDKLGLDIEGLEKEMGVYQPKMTIKYSKESDDSFDPVYAYETDSGFDLYSTEQVVLGEFGRELVPTGLHIDIPDGYEIQVRSKSGLAIKEGLMVLNSPGTVDQGYTGEIKVIIFNTNPHPITINKGQKIAQAVLSPVVCGKWVKFTKVKNIEDKDRSDNGFGSTGI